MALPSDLSLHGGEEQHTNQTIPQEVAQPRVMMKRPTRLRRSRALAQEVVRKGPWGADKEAEI